MMTMCSKPLVIPDFFFSRLTFEHCLMVTMQFSEDIDGSGELGELAVGHIMSRRDVFSFLCRL